MRAIARTALSLSLLSSLWLGDVRVVAAGRVVVPTGLTNLYVNALVMDSSGNLYAGTSGGGVYKIQLTSWSALN
jgi:hypothetical protein